MLSQLRFILIVLFCTNCTSSSNEIFLSRKTQAYKTIYLVGHDWHAGIVVKRSDIPEDTWPEHKDFTENEYLEIGWGEQNYYQKSDPSLGDAIKAGLWPTSSVLHIAGFNGAITSYFPNSKIIKINLSYQGFKKLCQYIKASYAKDRYGQSIKLSPGLYGNSHFYLAKDSYHAFRTCNVWAAKALQAAEYPISPASSLIVESLMSQAAKHGVIIQEAN